MFYYITLIKRTPHNQWWFNCHNNTIPNLNYSLLKYSWFALPSRVVFRKTCLLLCFSLESAVVEAPSTSVWSQRFTCRPWNRWQNSTYESPVSACMNYSYSLWLVAIKESCVLLFDYAGYSAESEHVQVIFSTNSKESNKKVCFAWRKLIIYIYPQILNNHEHYSLACAACMCPAGGASALLIFTYTEFYAVP